MLRTALLALLLALPMGAPTLAIQRSADELVPSPADFGPGWSLVSDLDVDALIQSPLVSGAGATLAGPGGARVLMLVVVVEPTPTAARRTWEFGNQVFDEARSGFNFDFGSERDVGALPEGCADARRGAGNDRLFGQTFPVGLTLCAADPDAVVFVATSGSVLGRTGREASDAVVELVLGSSVVRPAPQPRGEVRETPAADDAGQSGAANLRDLLPAADRLPAGFPVVNEGARSERELADALGGTDEVSALLDEWGWEGNVYRDFLLPSEAALGATIFYSASVHRFADPEAADNALAYFSDYVVASQGLEEVEVEPLGDAVRALHGAPEGVAFAVLYVRDGPLLYRIAGSSNTADADPTADVMAFAETVVPPSGLDDRATSPVPEAVPTGGEATPTGDATPARTVTVTSHDIFYEPDTLTIPANRDVVVALPNEGAAPHSFVIDDLGISVELAPGETAETTINAAPGEYTYSCVVPGHKHAGMVGTLIVG